MFRNNDDDDDDDKNKLRLTEAEAQTLIGVLIYPWYALLDQRPRV